MRSAFVEHKRVQAMFKGPGRTRQEFKKECDINTIMKQYEKTGVISHMNQRSPMYLDYTLVPNLQGALDVMINAEAAFMTLPARVRKEFGNDAKAFVEFASKDENIKKMREWGLAAPEKAPEEPIEVIVREPVPVPEKPAGKAKA